MKMRFAAAFILWLLKVSVLCCSLTPQISMRYLPFQTQLIPFLLRFPSTSPPPFPLFVFSISRFGLSLFLKKDGFAMDGVCQFKP